MTQPPTTLAPIPDYEERKPTFLGKLRDYLLTGLLVLAPTAVTVWVLYRLLNWMDNLLGRFLKFEAVLGGQRIPGLGLLATLVLLIVVGWLASWIGARSLGLAWDRLLTRIPGLGILYSSAKSVGEALLSKKKQDTFRQVVLVQWPLKGTWRVGFLTGPPSQRVLENFEEEIEVVFVPHSPNPASGFVHYVPKTDVVYLDWPVEAGLKIIISGGVVQPPDGDTAVPDEPTKDSAAEH